MLIYKNILPTDTCDIGVINLPAANLNEARKCILKLETQHGTPCIWYDVGREEAPLTKYLIIPVGTGQPWEDTVTRENYIGTVQLHGGMLVLHYFLLKPNDNM